VLLRHGASLDVTDALVGGTPLTIAQKAENPRLLNMLAKVRGRRGGRLCCSHVITVTSG
jgi:hypothetical protein